MQANATKRLHKFRNRSHFSRDAKRMYEKTYYSHASSVVSTVTQTRGGVTRKPHTTRMPPSVVSAATQVYEIIRCSFFVQRRHCSGQIMSMKQSTNHKFPYRLVDIRDCVRKLLSSRYLTS
ncbi:hypothetical protein CSKR_112107 [Clonorchis sinensis]|uniref:Uncharacterized protein n=1 Tax=Clonorchis sinensis TaxID=79923 RepID=A0A3R7DGI1_CLOSI|nr:hypothetical protein CSKR_112107 [Clonorchis sinensis]